MRQLPVQTPPVVGNANVVHTTLAIACILSTSPVPISAHSGSVQHLSHVRQVHGRSEPDPSIIRTSSQPLAHSRERGPMYHDDLQMLSASTELATAMQPSMETASQTSPARRACAEALPRQWRSQRSKYKAQIADSTHATAMHTSRIRSSTVEIIQPTTDWGIAAQASRVAVTTHYDSPPAASLE